MVAVTTFWFICAIGATMYFWDYHITLWFGNVNTSLCLVICIFSYTKNFPESSPSSISSTRTRSPRTTKPNASCIARYRKAVSSALWMQLTLFVCYLPQGIIGALWTNREEFSQTLYLAWQFASTLVFLNSSLNPILYCWKTREVRRAVKDTISHFCCSSS